MGFLSRFVMVSYSYNLSTVAKILDHYSEHVLNLSEVDFPLPESEIDIALPIEIADKLDPFAVRIGEQFRLYGIRAKINLRCLLKCLAYQNGKNKVTYTELEEFLRLADFMNFDFNPL